MSEIAFEYPFDPTGLKASNQITGEKQVISAPPWRDYHFIIPKLTPFFRDSFLIRDLTNNRLLVEGVDYLFSHRFISATRATAKPVYGSVSFLDKSFSGVVELEYQTLGGEWTVDGDELTEKLVYNKTNPRITSWEQVQTLPRTFPVIDHQWNLNDMVGMSEVRDAIEGIGLSIESQTEDKRLIVLHRSNRDNPHGVTKQQTGLGNVENFPVSTRLQAIGGTHEYSYMTPRRTRQAIEQFSTRVIITHKDDRDNPHGVTKEQVELGNVDNYSTATIAESMEGRSERLFLTPRGMDAYTKTTFYTRDEIDSRLGTLNEAVNETLTQQVNALEDKVRVLEQSLTDAISVAKREIYTELLPLIKTNHERTSTPHQESASTVGLGDLDNAELLSLSDIVAYLGENYDGS